MNWAEDPATSQWLRAVHDELVPLLRDSAFTLSVVPTGGRADASVKYWLELGAAIMLDKPIMVVAAADVEIPSRLRRVADEVVELERGVGGMGEVGDLMRAYQRMQRRFG